MKSEFCHINLLYGTVDMKRMVVEDINDNAVAEKLRKFYIPILGLLTMKHSLEPEVIKEVKMILSDWKVDKILKEIECDRDRVPMGISETLIPDLMKFVPTNSYFIDDKPGKFDMPKKIDRAEQRMSRSKPIPKEKSQELFLRRCASIDKVSPQLKRKADMDKVLFMLQKPVTSKPEHRTISDTELSEDEELEYRPTALFNLLDVPKKDPELTEYQKLSLMNPFLTLNISRIEPSILEEKPPLPLLSHPNAGDFMALVALEAMQVLPREWVSLHQDGDLTVMCRSLSQKGLVMIKSFSSLQRPPEQVLNVLLHSDITRAEESIFPCFTVIEVRPYFDVVHFQVNTVKGLTPREWLARRCHVKDFPCERGFTMLLNNMDSETHLVATDAVKGKVLSGGIVARPIGKKATAISLVFKAELGGLIPVRILHQMIVVTIRKFIADLRKYCDIVSEYDSEAEAAKEAEEVDPEFIQ
jgi:hypothetical protein